jgi:type IV fimbrial biogenesis protein FimT
VNGTRGFTIIELMVVLVIASLMMGMAAPSLRNFTLDNSTASATNELVASLHLARMEAATLGARVVVCRSGTYVPGGLPTCDAGVADTAHDGYEDGWIVFKDDDGNWQPDQATDILRRQTPDTVSSITIRGQRGGNNSAHIAFTPLGFSAGTTGTLVVCDARGWSDGGRHARAIVVGAQGRIKTVAGNTPGVSSTSCTP